MKMQLFPLHQNSHALVDVFDVSEKATTGLGVVHMTSYFREELRSTGQ